MQEICHKELITIFNSTARLNLNCFKNCNHRNHLTVVEQFGHFPHRNEIMGRESTPEEVKFLNDPAFRFDLPLVFKEDGTVTFAPTDEFNNRQQLVDNFSEEEGDAEE